MTGDGSVSIDARLRSVFRATPIGITFNVARVIYAVNDSMCELMGYSEQELVGQSARLFYDSDAEYTRSGQALYEPLMRLGRTSVEANFVRKDGTPLAVVLTAALLDLEEPGAGYVVTVQDVTARKRSEQALRTSEEHFRCIIEQSPFSIQIFSVQGELVSANAAFYTLFGLSRTSVPDYNLLRDRFLESRGFLPLVQRAFKGERVSIPMVNYESNTVAQGTVQRVVQAVFYPLLNESGKVQNVIAVHVDLTERTTAEKEQHRLQEQLQQAMKMEAVGRLAGGIAHDFNNLLTSISGNAELAQLDVLPDSTLLEYLQEIRLAADSAAGLTRQLLAFSRRQVIEPRVLNLNSLIEHLKKMLVRIIGDDVILRTSLSTDLGSVKIDPGQFEQVLVNLAVNARDAMPNGGQLIIETANVELDDDYCAEHVQSKPGRHLLLSMSDTGHGMTDEVKQRLFEPFYTTKPQGKGTGLGLATIFGVVKQSNGNIEVYSEVGLGTTFKIYLPIVDEAPQALMTDKPVISPKGGTETILLAEDNERVLTFARILLTKLGYKVLFACDGTSALATARQYPESIALLITDVVMPGMNGRELAAQVTTVHPETKVLFTSGYAEDVIIHHGVLDRNLEFISKPYSRQSLSVKIRSILDR